MKIKTRMRKDFIDIVWGLSSLVHELEQHNIVEYEWRYEILVPYTDLLDIIFITNNIMDII